jgi:hypothetical protein
MGNNDIIQGGKEIKREGIWGMAQVLYIIKGMDRMGDGFWWDICSAK